MMYFFPAHFVVGRSVSGGRRPLIFELFLLIVVSPPSENGQQEVPRLKNEIHKCHLTCAGRPIIKPDLAPSRSANWPSRQL
jgi:hypothetical protein